ncbi:MAG: hypothetical protein QOJ86_3142 [Bradyrhizobium sp.]|jgi:hypothetical protein|nr:hypothetical protein [Bradyrhizobium sp.]
MPGLVPGIRGVEPIIPSVRPTAGTFRTGESSSQNLELSMQDVVDRVKRAFTLNQPISDREAEAIRRDATEFAINLLAKYKSQLAQRTLTGATER